VITITQRGSFSNSERWLRRITSGRIFESLSKYGDTGVAALSAATPVDSGLTAASWTYEIVQRRGYLSIRWKNTNKVAGKPLAVLLQYGHGTGTGGYVQGRDYVNPAIRPIFEQIAAEAQKEVSRL
jgi:hypothetical protein